jgi:hypothetical protein
MRFEPSFPFPLDNTSNQPVTFERKLAADPICLMQSTMNTKLSCPLFGDPKPCQRDKVNTGSRFFWHSFDYARSCQRARLPLSSSVASGYECHVARPMTGAGDEGHGPPNVAQSVVFLGSRAMRSIVSSLSTSVCQTAAATWAATIPRMIHEPATWSGATLKVR